ncbi:MAG: hypothetical protein GY940_24485 [bacterium]|nr:hypothetical protein [bacterium]
MKRLLIVGLVLILGSLILTAGTYRHEDGGLSIWFPDDWEVETDDGVLEAEAPDDDAFAQFMVLPDVKSMEDAIDAYAEELDDVFNDFEVTGEAQEVEFNGLELYIIEGEGKVDGVNMEAGVAVIRTGKAFVLCVTFGTVESNEKYEEDFKKIVQSLQAI